MGIAVSTPASSRRLTRAQTVLDELGSGDKPTIERLIDQASAAIVRHCRREFARAAVVESVPGNDLLEIQLSRTPIARVTSVSVDGDVITDYSIEDRDEGTLYRRDGWAWTAQRIPGFGGRQRFPGWGQALAGREEPSISVSYVGGYLVPEQYLLNVVTLSASATDNSFNDSASGFPALLSAGDILVVSGFTSAANNGRFVVTGTPTASKVTVSATLTTESADPASSRSISFDPPDECHSFFDLEKACIETVKDYFTLRGGQRLTQRTVSSITEQFQAGEGSLPPFAAGLLQKWVRTV